MDIRAYNREAWNREVETGNPWTKPVGPEVIALARQGQWSVLLTPTKPVPQDWFPEMPGCELLCLACGGGQQGPVFAAAGAQVTVLDNSPKQLAQDRLVADREGLALITLEGDMRDLSVFAEHRFDLVFHPVSNLFVPDIQPVWEEAFRVLRPGGSLLAGFVNPLSYIFDYDLMEKKGLLEVKYSIPYSDLASLPMEKRQEYLDNGWPLEFSHTLEEQIDGQLQAGFLLTGFYEDIDPTTQLGKIIPTFIATRAQKPYFEEL
ncbi:MAG: class I SAM-dependent methyltransferase [Anaerolineales bacterium]|nr:class I SAM-dependent methyltransferase [Anaerolineales bacterium]